MKVVITGGLGFLGLGVARALSGRGDVDSIVLFDAVVPDTMPDGLNGKGFVFENPNAKKACGCGTSFSI